MGRIFIVPVVAGVLFTMSACGAEDTTSTAPSARASTPAIDTSPSPPGRGTTPADAADDTTGTAGDRGAGGVPGGPPGTLEDGCVAVSTLYVAVVTQTTSGLGPGASSADELATLGSRIDDARSDDRIPAEIVADFEVWSAAWLDFGDAVAGIGEVGILDPANASRYEAAVTIIDNPEVEAAGSGIEAYVTENCAAGALVGG